MATYSLKIPSSIGVIKPIEFIKNKLWISPLNESIQPIESDFTSKNVEFLFCNVKDYQEIEKLVTEWFKFFGSILPITSNFSYLALNRHIYRKCFEEPSELTISCHLKSKRAPQNEEIPFYRIVDNKLLVPFNRLLDWESLNIVELYKKYQSLEDEDELRSNIEFLSISKNLNAHASYFHDNVF